MITKKFVGKAVDIKTGEVIFGPEEFDCAVTAFLANSESLCRSQAQRMIEGQIKERIYYERDLREIFSKHSWAIVCEPC